MATFVTQVEALTSLDLSGSSTPTETELTQFLNDGVLDVTAKWLFIKPQDAVKFIRVSGEVTSNGSEKVDKASIVTVVREADTNDDWRECKFVPPALQSRVTDTTSIYYASTYSPVYTILADGAISVFPTPGSTTKAFKVYYINNNPRNDSDDSLAYDSSGIAFFPKDMVSLVVKYAAIKAVEAKIASYSVDEEDSELVQSYANTYNAIKQDYDSFFGNAAKQVMRANEPLETKEQLADTPIAEEEE